MPAMLPKESIEKILPDFYDSDRNSFDGLLFRTHYLFYQDKNSWTRKKITTFTSDTLLDKAEVLHEIRIPFNTGDCALFSFKLTHSKQYDLLIEKIIDNSSLIFHEENVSPNVSLSCDIILTLGTYKKI